VRVREMAGNVGTADDLEVLSENHKAWVIGKTPGGLFVARRKRHFVETNDRIDLGFRYALIEKSAKALETQIKKQESLHEQYGVIL
jgi:hypothetical protein